jgi:2-polyprenyl-6-methoxyphenol hydroxylase-like FAD-dependent oxidoreductase
MFERVVVIGGSVAGLLAAAAVAPHAEEVLVLERTAWRPRSSAAAHGAFPHVLLGGGAVAIEAMVPGYLDLLRSRGAIELTGAAPCHWWAAGRVRESVADLGVRMPFATRDLVESTLRDHVGGIEGVRLVDETAVTGLRLSNGRVSGVELDQRGVRTALAADLVVAANGRSGRTAAWLAALGASAPRTTEVRVDLDYVAIRVRRKYRQGDPIVAIVQNDRSHSRLGVALQAEDDQLQVVLGGYFGHGPETTVAGMREFARTLPDPVVADLLEAEPLTDPIRYRFRSSRMTDWSRAHLPQGLAVVGDAVASFNPIYGQGMTSAALQASAVSRTLARHRGDATAAVARIPREVQRAVRDPWQVATGGDFVYPEVVGRRPVGVGLVNRYLERAFRAAAGDEVVGTAVARVQQLLAPPASLMSPRVAVRTLLA